MIFRNLDPSGDWTFGKGKSDFLSGVDAIGLNIKTRIKSWVGDCFFDTEAGIDWTNRLGSKNQRTLLENELRRIIIQSFGVASIRDFFTVQNGRSFSASYTIDTIYGKEYRDTITIGV